MATRQHPFPPEAVAWLTGQRARVLLVGAHRGLVEMLLALEHRVTVVDRSLVALGQVPATVATRIATVVEQLGLAPRQFDVVLLPQNLHTMVGGRALSEIGRALVPGGSIGVVYTTRDDTVPWVRRLAATLQQVDPTAMRGDYGTESVQHLLDCPHFPAVEEKSFRTWFPVTREALVTMVAQRPATVALPPADRDRLLAEVAAHYDAMARPPQPLLLPYQATCWRSRVSHDELSVPITLDEGLRILP